MVVPVEHLRHDALIEEREHPFGLLDVLPQALAAYKLFVKIGHDIEKDAVDEMPILKRKVYGVLHNTGYFGITKMSVGVYLQDGTYLKIVNNIGTGGSVPDLEIRAHTSNDLIDAFEAEIRYTPEAVVCNGRVKVKQGTPWVKMDEETVATRVNQLILKTMETAPLEHRAFMREYNNKKKKDDYIHVTPIDLEYRDL